jgi:hypothetical protein
MNFKEENSMKGFWEASNDPFEGKSVIIRFKGFSVRGKDKGQCLDLLPEAVDFMLFNAGKNSGYEIAETEEGVEIVFNSNNVVNFLLGGI